VKDGSKYWLGNSSRRTGNGKDLPGFLRRSGSFLYLRLPAEHASVRSGGWQLSVGDDLHGKTLGIVGRGNIGSLVAKVAHAFGMSVIAWGQNLTREEAEEHGARLVAKEALFREADIVTVHLVLSKRTIGIIGATELELMKPTAYLRNTSRAPLITEGALVAALKNHMIAGAALDVYCRPVLKSVLTTRG